LESFLFQEKLPLHWGKILFPFHGEQSISYLTLSPYQAGTRHALPFDWIDPFALKHGFSPEDPERIQCGLYDLLQNSYKQGHCAYPEARLLQELREKLNVPQALLEDSLELELISDNLILDTIDNMACIYLKDIWHLEREVYSQLLSFEQRKPDSWSEYQSRKFLIWAQELLRIDLAPLQQQAIETALSSSLAVITGGPGTGKTTLIRSLVTILQAQFTKFALCSPTGRAAQRLAEATSTPAKTIHRLLKYNVSTGLFTFNEERPLDLDLLLVDEASMVDLSLMSHLLKALPNHCSLILVGDADQIPPVGAGQVLQSILDSKRFPVVRLKDIFRQSEKSLIKINAHRINKGLMPLSGPAGTGDFQYIPVHGADHAKKVIWDLVTRVIPDKCGIQDPSQFQILLPMNRGPLGTQQLNEELRSLMTPNRESVAGFGQVFQKGDKVMVVKNDYAKDVFNGDIGFLSAIHHDRQTVEVQFDERLVQFPFDELDRLTLAYAISIHKSQGSEYRAVIVVLTDEHLPMAQRHLVYTAVTRGKEHVFLVAEPHALQTALFSNENNKRWQKLTELLQSTKPISDLNSPSPLPHETQI
jgi:exodeoxyribonuclease V alpha subunit